MNSAKIILAGNPNVGKSTVFNALTGLKQHTGNWSGKTVELAHGKFKTSDTVYKVFDLPGTYSVISNSPEEKIARDHICLSETDLTVIVADATCLERNLNLALQITEMTSRVLLCVNLADEAKRNGIYVDIDSLKKMLGIPVISICAKKSRDILRLKNEIANACKEQENGNTITIDYPSYITSAIEKVSEAFSDLKISDKRKRFISLKLLDNRELGEQLIASLNPGERTKENIWQKLDEANSALINRNIFSIDVRDAIVETLIRTASAISEKCITKTFSRSEGRTLKIDKILTSRLFGIPITLMFFGISLWITIVGANYPSQLLSALFDRIKPFIVDLFTRLEIPQFWSGLLIDGIYGTSAWVTAVMLPPMAIFFPLFTLLEDLGALPRIAFNLDRCFKCANTSGKQSLTMCMGLGCNAVGVTGCRIISSPSERLAAIITNTFMPCNGRFGMLTTLSAIFIGGYFCSEFSSVISAGFVLLLIIIGVAVTLLITKLLTSTILKSTSYSFAMELPPFRRPQIIKTLTRSLIDRTLHILIRALSIAAPAGAVIWLLANITVNNTSILSYCTLALEPFARFLGMDGAILLAFILALPANEIVLPIMLMCYLSCGQTVNVPEIAALEEILRSNGWSVLTAVNVMLFSLMHFPCATTLKTIKAETGSFGWTVAAFIIPSVVGIIVCMSTTLIWNLASLLL